MKSLDSNIFLFHNKFNIFHSFFLGEIKSCYIKMVIRFKYIDLNNTKKLQTLEQPSDNLE